MTGGRVSRLTDLAVLTIELQPASPPMARAWEWSIFEAMEGNLRPLRVWRDLGERVDARRVVDRLDAVVVAWPLQHRVPEVADPRAAIVIGPVEAGIDCAAWRRATQIVFGERPPYMRVRLLDAGLWHDLSLRAPHLVVLDATGRCPACGEHQIERVRCRVCLHSERNDRETATANTTGTATGADG